MPHSHVSYMLLKKCIIYSSFNKCDHANKFFDLVDTTTIYNLFIFQKNTTTYSCHLKVETTTPNYTNLESNNLVSENA